MTDMGCHVSRRELEENMKKMHHDAHRVQQHLHSTHSQVKQSISSRNRQNQTCSQSLSLITSEFWSMTRNDVQMMLQSLVSRKMAGEITQGELEYEELLKRWVNAFEHCDPPYQQPVPQGDPNKQQFQLPFGTDPASFRDWLKTWQPLDVKIAPGNVVWEVMPSDVIKTDQVTPEQEQIRATRAQKKDWQNPERMRRRREQLGKYFIQKRWVSPATVMPFLQWADNLQRNQAELDKLCQG